MKDRFIIDVDTDTDNIYFTVNNDGCANTYLGNKLVMPLLSVLLDQNIFEVYSNYESEVRKYEVKK